MTRALLTVAALLGAAAWGAPLKLAIVYGHNGGSAARAPLRYAEADAARVAAALAEVGGLGPAELKLLTGRPLADLEAALAWAKGRAAANPQTSLVVYLSSHADATKGLLPGGEALPWARLKALVAATGAKARVTIVDGCQASGLLETGARAVPTFTIEAEDELTVKGDAFITSSASDEPSLEAGQFQGSVFTQHLLAALRGAGDRSGDGRVSLEEAYRFAFERTTEGQSGQHPGFATRLSGYGELILSTPGKGAGLLLPDGVASVAVKDAESGKPLVSARRPEARRLAVPPGAWLVQVEQSAGLREGRVTVAAGSFTSVEIDRLGAVSRAVSLVRLSNDAPCFEVQAGRPDPRVAAMVTRLAGAIPGCGEGQKAFATLVVEPGAKGQLRVRSEPALDDAGFDASAPASGESLLLDAVRAWAAGKGAAHPTTNRIP